MAGSTRDVTYALRINTDDAKGKIPEVTGEAKASLDGLSSSTVKSGEDFQSWGAKVQEAAAGTGTMEVSVTELATALATGKINLAQFKDALGPIKTAEDEAALALGRFTDAMVKLGASEENPRRLGRAVVAAQVSVEALARSLQAVGKPIPPEMEASLKRAQVEIDRLNAKAGVYRDTAGDMAVKQKLAAQGMETMAARGGSLQGILGGLADSSNAFTGSAAKLGLALFGVIEAFKLGFEEGNKLRTLWKDWYGTEMPSLTNALIMMATGVRDATGAFDHHGVTARSVIGIHNENKIAIGHLNSELEKLVPGLKKSDEAIRNGAAAAALWTKQFDIMVKDGQDIIAYGKQHADDIINTLAPALKAGAISYAKMSEEMRWVIKSAIEVSAAHKHEVEALEHVTKAIKEKYLAEEMALQKKLTAINESIAADGLAVAAIYKSRDEQIKALNQMNLSQEEYSEKKKKILKDTAAAVDEADKNDEEHREKAEEISKQLQKTISEEKTKIDEAASAAQKQADAYNTVNNAVKTFVEDAPNTEHAFDSITKGGSSTAEEIGKAGKSVETFGEKLLNFVRLTAGTVRPEIDALIRQFQTLDEVTKKAASGSGGAGGGGTGTPTP